MKVFHRACVRVFVISERARACVCIHLRAAHKGESRGAAPGVFFLATRCLSLLSEGEIRVGGGEGDKGEGRGGRQGHQCSNHVT